MAFKESGPAYQPADLSYACDLGFCGEVSRIGSHVAGEVAGAGGPRALQVVGTVVGVLHGHRDQGVRRLPVLNSRGMQLIQGVKRIIRS